MDRFSAESLAGGGSLLCAFSLLTPWYVLEAGGVTGDGRIGARVLGNLALVLVGLAVLAGWRWTAKLHRLLPPFAAAGMALIVLVEFASPPSAANAIPRAGRGDPIVKHLADAFAKTLTDTLGLHYARTWGIWLAAAGAAMALAGTITVALRGRARPPARSFSLGS